VAGASGGARAALNATPRIVITGPPAAGKTTVRGVVVGWLAERRWRVADVSVDDALRARYPAGDASPDHAYDDGGALLLRRPAEQIPPAVVDAIDRCRAAKGGFVLELAGNECVTLLASGRDLLAGALVVALSAPVELRSRRNAARGVTLIPDDRLRAYDDVVPWRGELAAAGARVTDVNGAASLESVTAAVLDAVAAAVSSRSGR